MPDDALTPREAEQLAAAGVVADLPAEEIDAWALIIARPSGLFTVVSDLCCQAHTVGMLTHAATTLAVDVANLEHAEHT